jgi:drug/metabolite transporter (DMT)-like permease
MRMASVAAAAVGNAREYALLVVLAILWGASYAFIRLGVATIPPVTLIAARTLIGGALLFAILVLRGNTMPRQMAMWGRFMLQALLNSVVPFTLIAWAEQAVEAGLATILCSASPIFTFLITSTITRHEPVTFTRLFGVVAGIGGICLIVGIEALSGIGHALIADLALIAATLCFAGAAIFGRGFGTLDPVMPATGSMLCGAMMLVPISLVAEQPWTIVPSVTSVIALIALSVFSTAFAFALYFRLLRTLGSVGVTAQAYLRVPVGVAIGVVFLGENLAPSALIGLAGVIAGVAAMVARTRSVSPLRESHSGVVAGLVPAAPRFKAQSKDNRGGRDKPGRDPPKER